MRVLIIFIAALSVPLFVSAQEGFALLTGEDGPLSNAAGTSDLPAFLNQIYLLCIGIAVVVSILQIIRGGITWMLTDSVMEKGQAKHLVTIAIMGLLLVLSPVIVFNIINPCILSLSLTGNEECEGSLGGLAPEPLPPVPDAPPSSGELPCPTGEANYVTRACFGTEVDRDNWLYDMRLSGVKETYKPHTKCQKWETRISGSRTSQVCVWNLGISSPVEEYSGYCATGWAFVDTCIRFLYGEQAAKRKADCKADGGELIDLQLPGRAVTCPANIDKLLDKFKVTPDERDGGSCMMTKYYCKTNG